MTRPKNDSKIFFYLDSKVSVGQKERSGRCPKEFQFLAYEERMVDYVSYNRQGPNRRISSTDGSSLYLLLVRTFRLLVCGTKVSSTCGHKFSNGFSNDTVGRLVKDILTLWDRKIVNDLTYNPQ